MNIGDQQLSLAKKSTGYIKELLKNNIDIAQIHLLTFHVGQRSRSL